MKNRENLRRAFLAARAEEFAAAVPDANWTPSAEYREKIGKLARKTENPFWKYVNTAGKKAAAILLAVLIALSAMMSVKAIRESVVEFIVSIFEKNTELFVDLKNHPDAPKSIETYFSPSYLPEGYETVDQTDSEIDRKIDYRGKNGEQLLFRQNILNTSLKVNTEESALQEIKIGGNEAHWFTDRRGVTMLIWSDGNYLYDLYATEKLPIEELVKIAESVLPE